MKTIIKRVLTLGLFLSMTPVIKAQANTISIYLNDGTITNYLLSNVKNISFTNSSMKLEDINNTIQTWNFSTIQKYLYLNTSNIDLTTFDSKLKLYPSPFINYFTIQYSLEKQNKVEINLIDILGKKIDVIASSIENSGDHIIKYDNSKLAPGIYIIQIQIDNKIIQKQILKN